MTSLEYAIGQHLGPGTPTVTRIQPTTERNAA